MSTLFNSKEEHDLFYQHRQEDIDRQQADEDAARARLGLYEGQALGTLVISGKVWKDCHVAMLTTWLVSLEATRGTKHSCWNTNARLIEHAMR